MAAIRYALRQWPFRSFAVLPTTVANYRLVAPNLSDIKREILENQVTWMQDSSQCFQSGIPYGLFGSTDATSLTVGIRRSHLIKSMSTNAIRATVLQLAVRNAVSRL